MGRTVAKFAVLGREERGSGWCWCDGLGMGGLVWWSWDRQVHGELQGELASYEMIWLLVNVLLSLHSWDGSWMLRNECFCRCRILCHRLLLYAFVLPNGQVFPVII